MQLRLFAPAETVNNTAADAWLEQLLTFLEEDKVLVESAQRGYDDDFYPGPPHRLEQRILHWQSIYRNHLSTVAGNKLERNHDAISALRT